jgi:methyl-accepting chemotaxis protein
MNLNRVIITSHLTTAIASGAVCWFSGAHESTSPLAMVLLLGISVVVGYLVSRWLEHSLQQVKRAVLSEGDAPLRTLGVRDFDSLIEQMRSRADRWSDATRSARKQAEELHQLLAHIDPHAALSDRERVGNTVARLQQSLGSLVFTAHADLDQIAKDLMEMQRSTEEIAAGTDDQSEAVNRTATYVEQLSDQFDSVAEKANAARASASSARDMAGSAQSLMEDHLKRIDSLRTRVEGSERKLKALGERSQAINSIVGTIGAISSRTDMLALNASIESIRAGEQGRGFSVVADEVRKLAEQTALATREISDLIETIQSETDESIRLMAEQREDVCQEMQRLGATKERLHKIAQTCDASGAGIQEISRLAAHQLHLTQDLVTAVERISDVTRSNRSRVEGTGWTIRSIAKHTQHLEQTWDPIRSGLQIPREPRASVSSAAEIRSATSSSLAAAASEPAWHEAAVESRMDRVPALAGALD